MKAVKITLILVLAFSLITHIRGEDGTSIVKMLPWLGGQRPSFLDVGAVFLLLLMWWGLTRTSHQEDNSSASNVAGRAPDEDEYEGTYIDGEDDED